MESLDLASLFEWIHDRVEERWGKLAAWLITLGLVAATIGGVIWFFIHWMN